ncbi:MAG: VacB/RNase II family 3'-5' exoribonuclease [Myxococcota bacterium]|nr:VacB/RNase II family 3'-5' exoribonuclease [Myxococcota bacterium]
MARPRGGSAASSRWDEWVGREVLGSLRLLPDGRGSLIPENNELPPIMMFPEEIQGVFNGDKLLVTLEQDRRGKLKGKLVEVEERGPGLLVGTLWRRDKLVGVNAHPSGAQVIVEEPGKRFKTGHVVSVQLIPRRGRKRALRGRVLESLGASNDPKVQVEMAILAHGLSSDYPAAAVEQAEEYGEVDPGEVLRDGRRDLRDVLHVTIDGADARDFDDAVSCRFEGANCRVWVSIADVSAYVVEGTALDDEAQRRATSVYFPHKAIHMLPTELSTGLCSLNPNVPRLAMTAEMLVSSSGLPSEVTVYPALIQSGARLTYEEVEEALNHRRRELPEDNPTREKKIYSLLQDLSKVSRWFRKQRTKRGAVEFELGERKVVVDGEGQAQTIEMRERLESHRLIEDFMIAANEAVARYLLKKEWPSVYRIHETPDKERFAVVANWAKTLGLQCEPDKMDDPREVARFASKLGREPRLATGQVLLLRSMKQARYSIENVGHFGLASEAYLHFTSPIRRYPDLLVHRSLKRLLQKQRPLKNLEEGASHSSVQERAAMLVERDVGDLMTCQIASEFVGEEMDSAVVAVLAFGVFVRTRETFFEGLVPMDNINEYYQDYFEYVEESMSLVGRLSGRKITFGSELKVRLEGVNGELRRIDFELCGRLENRRRKAGEKSRPVKAQRRSEERGDRRRQPKKSDEGKKTSPTRRRRRRKPRPKS